MSEWQEAWARLAEREAQMAEQVQQRTEECASAWEAAIRLTQSTELEWRDPAPRTGSARDAPTP